MRVPDFLTALPAIGDGKRDRILAELEISPVKRLGGLGVRQRVALQRWLDGRFPPLQPRSPSTSPGRGLRVVADTDSRISGWCSLMCAATVPLPTAVGPARTMSRLRPARGCSRRRALLLRGRRGLRRAHPQRSAARARHRAQRLPLWSQLGGVRKTSVASGAAART
jgi:hypothetical protein